jgi:hypothetical protein
MTTSTWRTAAFLIASTAWLLAPAAFAVTPIDTVALSSDITIELDGVTFDDEDVADDDLAGTTLVVPIGSIPSKTGLNAYHEDPSNGDQLLSFDTTVELPGAVVVEPGDVARYDGANYSVEFDASAEGISSGVATDAVSETAGGDLILSFDTTVDLGGLTVDDEDLVSFDGATFALVFDGSANGVATGLDLDAVHRIGSNAHLIISFDTSGTVGGVDFDDEDLLEFTPGSGIWELAYDGSALHTEWPHADLQAVVTVPEPEQIILLISGTGFLATIGRRRAKPFRIGAGTTTK